jgi:putative membrane protein
MSDVMPHGFLGTRADLFMDVVIVFLTLLPVLMLTAFRAARTGRLSMHRNMQAGTLAVVLVVVVLFELDIRLTGGKAAFLAQNPTRADLVAPILRFHVAIATLTFLAWLSLAVASWSRFRATLPGAFSHMHRRLGKAAFVGACLVSATGALVHALLFVA